MKARLLGTIPKKLKSSAVPSLNLLPVSTASDAQVISKAHRDDRALAKKQKEIVMTLLVSKDPVKEKLSEMLPSTSQEISDYDILKQHYDTITQENESLKTSLEEAQNEISYLKNKVLEVENKIKSQTHDIDMTFTAKVTELFSNFLTPKQIKVVLKKQTKARWNSEEISRAFTIRYFSQRCYIYLRKTLKFPLPGLSTLQSWASNLNLRNGLLKDVLRIMETTGKLKTNLQRLTVILFDEVKITSTYEYDQKCDDIIGPHTYMQVVMARGLFDNWKQPVYIGFDTKMTKMVLDEIVISLDSIKYTVVACVSDCGGGNQGLWTELGISVDHTFYNHPVTQENVYFFPDAPHLLKLIRNWLIDTGFSLSDGKLICRTPLEELVSITDTEISSCHKLQDKHLTCIGARRQNVRLAAELLSNTTATALKRYASSNKQQANDLGDFIDMINSWYDTMNSYSPAAKIPTKQPYGKKLEEQVATLNKVKETFSGLRCRGKKLLQVFQKGIIISCSSMQALYTKLVEKYKISYILTHRLNQDSLENFFSQIRTRGGLHDHPSPLDAIYRVRMILLGKNPGIVQSSTNFQHHEGLNSEEYVVSSALTQAKITNLQLPQAPFASTEKKESFDSESVSISSDSSRNSLIATTSKHSEEDGLEYIAGYLARKHQKEFPNLGCYTYKNEPINFHSYSTRDSWVQSLSFGGLTQPSNSWLESVKILDKNFKKLHKNSFKFKNRIIKRTAAFLTKKMPEINLTLIRSFTRQRVFMRMKYLIELKNKNGLKRKATEDDSDMRRKSLKKLKKTII